MHLTQISKGKNGNLKRFQGAKIGFLQRDGNQISVRLLIGSNGFRRQWSNIFKVFSKNYFKSRVLYSAN